MSNSTSERQISPRDAVEAFAVPGELSLIDIVHPVTGKSWITGETLEEIRQRYPRAELVNIDAWCKAKGEMQDSPVTWNEIDCKQYHNWLECLPPVGMVADGFMVGEPSDHHAVNGKPRFQACVHIGDKYYASSRAMTISEFKQAYAAGIVPHKEEPLFYEI